MTANRFPFIRPAVPEPDEWLPLLEHAYRTRRFSNFGGIVSELEADLASRYSGRVCAAVANATLGLTACLLALRVQGEVVVPAFTFPATAHAVALAGCVPVFCEVGAETWELDPTALTRMIEERGPAAVIHVRALGLCRDLSDVEGVCAGAGLPLVVDAAAALGGSVEGADWVGGAGRAEVFSLHATKTFSVGEGGLVVGDPPVVDQVREVINFALRDGDVASPGLNAKMDEFAAARARAMNARLGPALESRRACVGIYRDLLDSPGIRHPLRPGFPPWQTYPVELVDPERRRALMDSLAAHGVETRAYYAPPLHRTTAFRSEVDLPVTDRLSEAMLCLPVYPDADAAERAELGAAVRAAVDENL